MEGGEGATKMNVDMTEDKGANIEEGGKWTIMKPELAYPSHSWEPLKIGRLSKIHFSVGFGI